MRRLKILFTTLFILCVTVVNAEDFSVDGIYYKIISKEDKTVKVTYKGSSSSYDNEYTGDVTIPESITYKGKNIVLQALERERSNIAPNLQALKYIINGRKVLVK